MALAKRRKTTGEYGERQWRCDAKKKVAEVVTEQASSLCSHVNNLILSDDPDNFTHDPDNYGVAVGVLQGRCRGGWRSCRDRWG